MKTRNISNRLNSCWPRLVGTSAALAVCLSAAGLRADETVTNEPGADAANATVGATNMPIVEATPNEAGRFGVGAIFGEPTGVSVKYWLSDKHAIDGALAWS